MLKDKILLALKTKYKDLGLSQKILEGFATRLAKTVTEEDKIEDAVNDVEPELQIWQSVLDANRKEVSDLKKQLADTKKTDSSKGEEGKTTTEIKTETKTEEKQDDTPAWAKALMGEVQALKTEKVTNSRKTGYEALFADVKDDKLKTNKLDQFDRLAFKDEEDYNTFLEKEKEFLKDFNQDQANESLKGERRHQGQSGGGKAPNDKELDAVVDSFKI